MTARKALEPESELNFELVSPDELEVRLPFNLGYRVVRSEFTSPVQSGTTVFFNGEFIKGCAFWRPVKGLIQFSETKLTVEGYMASAQEKGAYAPKAGYFTTNVNEFMRYYRMAWNVRNPASAAPSAPVYQRKQRVRRRQSGTSVDY